MLRKRDCRQFEFLLWDYAEGRLGRAETAQINAHLLRCEPCRHSLAAYRQTAAGLAGARSRALPESQARWQEVCDRLATAPEPRRAGSRQGTFSAGSGLTLRRLAGAGAIAAAAVGVWACFAPHLRKPAPLTPELTAATKSDTRDNTLQPLKSALDARSSSAAWAKTARFNKAGTGAAISAPGRKRAAAIAHTTTPGIQQTIHWRHWRTASASGRRRLARRSARPAVEGFAAVPYGLQAANALLLAQASDMLARQDAAEQAQRSAPEYVLTAVEDNASAPRDYVMDGVSAESVRAPHSDNENTRNTNPQTRETRAW